MILCAPTGGGGAVVLVGVGLAVELVLFVGVGVLLALPLAVADALAVLIGAVVITSRAGFPPLFSRLAHDHRVLLSVLVMNE